MASLSLDMVLIHLLPFGNPDIIPDVSGILCSTLLQHTKSMSLVFDRVEEGCFENFSMSRHAGSCSWPLVAVLFFHLRYGAVVLSKY